MLYCESSYMRFETGLEVLSKAWDVDDPKIHPRY